MNCAKILKKSGSGSNLKKGLSTSTIHSYSLGRIDSAGKEEVAQ